MLKAACHCFDEMVPFALYFISTVVFKAHLLLTGWLSKTIGAHCGTNRQ
ncbi:hypothetical protein Cabys_1673 [Caldithrix abyssi DSM 13497]|uniref:Uncharacterized protein n=1 Tax=Caldithrix abyssi DSM 13497 TaxID=880073 RepID=A0A1J1C783_CALAY|nr:hypothetical protein Cabys_1673 [Caldithrix abyssi DSM 13497]